MGKHSRPEEQAAQFCRRSSLCVFLMQQKMASLDVHVVANILCLVLANFAPSESTMLGAHIKMLGSQLFCVRVYLHHNLVQAGDQLCWMINIIQRIHDFSSLKNVYCCCHWWCSCFGKVKTARREADGDLGVVPGELCRLSMPCFLLVCAFQLKPLQSGHLCSVECFRCCKLFPESHSSCNHVIRASHKVAVLILSHHCCKINGKI